METMIDRNDINDLSLAIAYVGIYADILAEKCGTDSVSYKDAKEAHIRAKAVMDKLYRIDMDNFINTLGNGE